MAKTYRAGDIELRCSCESGMTDEDLAAVIPADELPRFWQWMNGQTFAICEGRRYHHMPDDPTKDDYATGEGFYEEKCGGVAHGRVVYPWDVARFLSFHGKG